MLLAFLVGFLIAVPAAGPATALIVRYMLRGRRREGLAFAFGATSAEGLACLAAVWGIEFAFRTLPNVRTILEWGGTVIVLAVGIYLVRTAGSNVSTSETVPDTDGASLGGRTLAGFAVTAFNPTLIATWATLVGIALSVTGLELAAWQKWAIPPAVTLGGMSWFGLLSVLTRRFGGYLDEQTIGWIIRTIGILLIVLGGWGLFRNIAGAW